jgi:predicted glycosyltransferase
VRSAKLIEALAKKFAVTFVSGNTVPDCVELPRNVRIETLPVVGLSSMGVASRTENPEARLAERAHLLAAIAQQAAPEVVITELFPFGRHKLMGELLALIRETPQAAHVSSVRDVLVSHRQDQLEFDRRSVDLLNAHFDALLLHVDAHFKDMAPLPLADEIRVPIYSTGFVAQKLPSLHPKKNEILVSAGGGLFGGDIYRSAVAAQRQLKPLGLPMRIVTGPFFPEGELQDLRVRAQDVATLTIERSVPGLGEQIANASFAIAQCGYNTAMELLGSNTPALVVPFERNGENEQILRARRMEQLGRIKVLRESQLTDESMTVALRDLMRFRPASVRANLDGAERSVDILENLIGGRARVSSTRRVPRRRAQSHVHDHWLRSNLPNHNAQNWTR